MMETSSFSYLNSSLTTPCTHHAELTCSSPASSSHALSAQDDPPTCWLSSVWRLILQSPPSAPRLCCARPANSAMVLLGSQQTHLLFGPLLCALCLVISWPAKPFSHTTNFSPPSCPTTSTPHFAHTHLCGKWCKKKKEKRKMQTILF